MLSHISDYRLMTAKSDSFSIQDYATQKNMTHLL